MVVLATGGWVAWNVWSAQKGNAKQRTRTIFQYLRLLRFELLFLVALIALPVIATEIAPSLLANLLVVDSAADAIAVTLLAFTSAWLAGEGVSIVVKRACERVGEYRR